MPRAIEKIRELQANDVIELDFLCIFPTRFNQTSKGNDVMDGSLQQTIIRNTNHSHQIKTNEKAVISLKCLSREKMKERGERGENGRDHETTN